MPKNSTAQTKCLHYYFLFCVTRKNSAKLFSSIHPLYDSTVTSLKPGCRDKLARFSTSPCSRLFVLPFRSSLSQQAKFPLLSDFFFFPSSAFLFFWYSVCVSASIEGFKKVQPALHHAFVVILVPDHISAMLIILVKCC